MIAPLILGALQAQDRITAISPAIPLVHISEHGAVKGFWIGKYELTIMQYAAFVHETHYDGSDFPTSKPTEAFLMDWKRGHPPKGKDNYPVCYLNWHHAKAFCSWLSKKADRDVRLPTDAEWTLAAAGIARRTFPWGNSWDPKRCNWGDGGRADGFAESAPVGSFPLGNTPEGLCDMAGNIWEWSAEGHLRGGPWCMDKTTLECATIAREVTERCDDKFGFRIAVSER